MPALLRRRLLFLLIAAGLLPFAAGQNLSSAADFAALYSIRASLGLRSRDWPRKVDPCSSWAGVGCDAGGRVISLELHGLRRTRLARQNPRFSVDGIQNLTRLASFNATGFTLLGSIPNWFGNRLPPTLTVLDLRRASIYGVIPYSLGDAAGLTALTLAENSITGDIPPTLGKLGNLSFLDLSRNALSGDVPAELTAIANIAHLDLSSNYLSGTILPEIGYLSNLETLILANNSFTGSIPHELGIISSLLTLDLSFNSLFGSLPESLSDLRNLRNLNLGNNFLAGSLTPTFFSGLPFLESIALSRNNFSGELPNSLWSLTKLHFLDVSHNNFTGSLPELFPAGNARGGSINLSHNLLYGPISAGFAALLSILSFADISNNYLRGFALHNRDGNLSLKSNCLRNGSNQRSQSVCLKFYEERGLPYHDFVSVKAPHNTSFRSSSSRINIAWKYIVIAVVAGTALLVSVIISVILCLRWCKRHPTEQKEVNPNPSSSSPANLSAVGVSFTLEQLAMATSGFSDGNLIKIGHSGGIYHGVLEDGIHVIVKKVDVRKESYLLELDFFVRFSHERLVPFLGHCFENDNEKENEKFLVYRRMAHGDLSSALYRKNAAEKEGLQSLDWITRLKIAIGVAEALCFLHHECVPPLVHRDIQASSILLDDKFEVRLGSFSSVCPQEDDGHQNVFSRFLRLSQTSEQSASGLPPASTTYDVYCFGKVLLELVTGKLGISGSNEASTNEWLEHTLRFINIYEMDLVTKIVDPSLIVDDDLLEEVWAMAIVARSCLNPKPAKRPLTKHILKALENPLKVVREDTYPGSGRLKATSSRSSWNAAFFGSWRHSSSDIPSISAQPRDDWSLKRSGTARSQGSAGERSFSRRRPSKEIFPEPDDED